MISVSVIIPNYNHALYLEQRIESVLNQTFQDFEIILLDDCSTDNSREIIEQYKNNPKFTHVVFNKTNSGSPFKQWEKGLELAKGDYIWIAESDDWADHNFLATLIPLLEDGAGLAYCRTFTVNHSLINKTDYFWGDELDSTRWKSDYKNSGKDEIKNYLIFRNTIPNASACVFKKKHLSFEPKIQNMRFCGDWLFWINLLEKTNIAFTSDRLSYFRMHNDTSRSIKSKISEYQRLQEYFFVINNARKKVNVGSIKFSEREKYHWIISEILYKEEKRIIWKMVYPLPVILFFDYVHSFSTTSPYSFTRRIRDYWQGRSNYIGSCLRALIFPSKSSQ
jgi:glycosyltransferase involved in cell wall biosynthesis